MENNGFVHDMMDLKVLILYISARLSDPISMQELYELCFQDDSVSYFDICTAVPEMVKSGHLEERDGGYVITEKGREDGLLTEDSVAFSVRRKAEGAALAYEKKSVGTEKATAEACETQEGWCARLQVDKEDASVMTMELPAESRSQAMELKRRLQLRGDMVYSMVMAVLFDEEI